MKKYRKLLAVTLAALMLLAAGCAGSETKQSSSGSQSAGSKTAEGETKQQETSQAQSEEAPKEVVRITMYPFNSAAESGVRQDFYKDFLAEHGIELEVWAFSTEKTNAIMASGDLPDLMHVDQNNLKILIEEGMILNLEDYLDQMPHVKALGDTMVNYMREFQSAGTGQLYALPKFVGKPVNDGTTERSGVKFFWDYYVEAGTPEFSSLDDMIPVLKEIQEKHPQDENGHPVYAVGTYYDASNMNFLYGYSCPFGYANSSFSRMCGINLVDETVEYLLEDDSILKEALVWYNKLYKEGLFDPDSINMDRPTHQAMISGNGKNGTYILSLADSPGWETYYQQVYFEGERLVAGLPNPYGGGSEFITINAETKNLDTCLAMLDLLADPDAYLVWRGYPEGELWEAENGVAHLTERYLNLVEENKTKPVEEQVPFTFSNGDELPPLYNINFICNQGNDTSYVDKDGNVLGPMVGTWPEMMALNSTDERLISWKETTGYENWVALLQDKGALYQDSRLALVDNFLEDPTDAQRLTINSLNATIIPACWKMIYSETQEEFDSIWEQMVIDAEGLGAREMYEWQKQNIENAAAIRASLSE